MLAPQISIPVSTLERPRGSNIHMLKNIKTIAVSMIAAGIASFGISHQSAHAGDVQDFLSSFDFETGRVLIVAPEGVQPSSDWSIRFSADFGSKVARSTPIVIDYSSDIADTSSLPDNVSQDNAFMLAVKSELSSEAAKTRSDFVSLSQMDGADKIDINMQLGASFKIETEQRAAVCAHTDMPTPVDVWIQPSEGADWQRLSDMENLWKFGFFLRSAINSACPTI